MKNLWSNKDFFGHIFAKNCPERFLTPLVIAYTFIWDESEDEFSAVNTTEIADDNDITIQSYAALRVGSTKVSDLTSDNGFLFWTRNSGGTAAEIRQLGSGGILNLKNSSGTLIRVANDGNLGVGNSSPSYKLDVSGKSRITKCWYR